jgi:hypothetical protein
MKFSQMLNERIFCIYDGKEDNENHQCLHLHTALLVIYFMTTIEIFN